MGVVALLLGAVLAVAGSLRPLYEQERVDSGFRSGFRMTSWSSQYTTPDGGVELVPDSVLYGVPMVVAAALLVLVALLVPFSQRLPARAVVAIRVGAVAAATMLVGCVWTVGQAVLVVARENDAVRGSIETRVGSGMWTLVAAAVVAFAGGLLVQRLKAKAPVAYQLPDDDDTDTPPMGIPIHPSVSTEESSPG